MAGNRPLTLPDVSVFILHQLEGPHGSPFNLIPRHSAAVLPVSVLWEHLLKFVPLRLKLTEPSTCRVVIIYNYLNSI